MNREELARQLTETRTRLEGLVDESLALVAEGKAEKQEVMALWEEMLGHFLGHVRESGRTHGVDLLRGLSLANILLGARR